MPALPTGTVTYLFTDVEGSTRLWEQHPAEMRVALARHDTLIEAAVEGHGGTLVRPRGEGDSRFAVFARATDAVAAAAAIQQALQAEPWPPPVWLRVRLALHTGEADLRAGDYYGSAVNRCARLRAIAHGGQTLLSQATSDLIGEALPPRVGLRALGTHRLSDLQRAEQVYQLVVAGLPAEFPPLRSLETSPHNLPLQVTSFVGREREMDEIITLLRKTRLLTLTGPGGTGKTRLAVQVAADVLAGYPHGVWLVELAPLADPALVPGAVAAVLNVRAAPSRPLLTTLTEALRAQQLLLVLDNCEHLIDACAQLADALVRTCPRVQVLATSREALGIAGETAYRVPSLALPQELQIAGVEVLAQVEAVRLFVERAAAVQPRFALTPTNAAEVAQVCRRLDGIPLALEMAAARVAGLAVEQLAARLDQRFRLLTGGSRAALPRQQTLRATVEWSYDLLSPEEQMLFTRLSVFAGGWMLEAAEAVCAGGAIAAEDVLDLLLRLVAKSLVLAEESDGGVRYRLLEMLRQYGRERLVAGGEAAELHTWHASYYLALAEQAEEELRGPEQARWYEQLEREHDNLRAALAWYQGEATQGEGEHAVQAGEYGLRLGGALVWFWFHHSHWREGRAWLEQALARGAAAPAAVRAKALHGAGLLAAVLEDDPHSQELLVESVALSRESGDRRQLVLALSDLGSKACRIGQVEHAAAVLDEAVAVARAVGDPWLLAFALLHHHFFLASPAITDAEERARARAVGEESARLFAAAGDARNTAMVRTLLGALALHEGDYMRAHAAFSASLPTLRALDARPRISFVLARLADGAHAQGDDREAATLYTEAVALYRQGRWPGRAADTVNVLCRLAEMALEQGDWLAAQSHAVEGMKVARDLGEKAAPSVAQTLQLHADLAAVRNEPQRAVRLAGAAAALHEHSGAQLPAWLQDRRSAVAAAALHDRLLAQARASLSAEEQATAWAEGQAMTLEQAVACALERPAHG